MARLRRLRLVLEEITASDADKKVSKVTPMATIIEKVTYGTIAGEMMSVCGAVEFGVPI